MPDTLSEIHKLSARRQAIWDGASETVPLETQRIAAKLSDLYEDLRMERAQQGSPKRTRESILRRARVESELERLSS